MRFSHVFNRFPNKPCFFTGLQYKSFENNVGKGEIARYEQFLLLPRCFLPLWRTCAIFLSNLKLSTKNYLSLEESKICYFGVLSLAVTKWGLIRLSDALYQTRQDLIMDP